MRVGLVFRKAKLSYDRVYSYRWPEHFPRPCLGQRVLAPFGSGNRLEEAYVWKIATAEEELETKQSQTAEVSAQTERLQAEARRSNRGQQARLDLDRLKWVAQALESECFLLATQRQLVEQIRLRYACTYGEALRLMLPPGLSVRLTKRYSWRSPIQSLQDEEAKTFFRYKNTRTFYEHFSAVENLAKATFVYEELSEALQPSAKALQCLVDWGYLTIDELVHYGHQVRKARYVSLPSSTLAQECLESGLLRSNKQTKVLELLLDYGELALSEVLQLADVSAAVVKGLEAKGLVAIQQKAEADEPESLQGSEAGGFAELPHRLNEEQAKALASLEKGMAEASPKKLTEFLLYGVTGSGKTELYLQAAARVLQQGKTVLFLVPEIALTAQMVDRVRARFPEGLELIHSRLTPRARYEAWRRILEGKSKLVVGPRSALFMPLQNLGLIILDEEQESSYHSEQFPYYDARTVARLRARGEGALLVLGSATPSVETFYRSEQGLSQRLELRHRAVANELAACQIVDLRQERQMGRLGADSLFSVPLLNAMEEAFQRGEQAILFLNRRGYAGLMLCRACGEHLICPRCSVSLTCHQANRYQPKRLICHYCSLVMPIPTHCPRCQSHEVASFGLGTQQVEEAFKRLFPERTLVRMDQDTTQGVNAHRDLLEAFRQGEADVLLGTQMIAKGHDFPKVSVMGILACDQLFAANDFRGNERAFQLMTQAAGRAGRAHLPAKVFFQTFAPDSFVLQTAAQQDYDTFYREELVFRRQMAYPPFAAFLTLTLSANSEHEAEAELKKLQHELEKVMQGQEALEKIKLFPIQKAYPFRLNNRYRFRLNLKGQELASLAYLMLVLRHWAKPYGIQVQALLDPA